MKRMLAKPVNHSELRIRSRDPLKLTALLYLREALLWEKYEECAGLISYAKEFGAEDFEVQFLLEDPRRVPG